MRVWENSYSQPLVILFFSGKLYLIYTNRGFAYFTSIENRENVITYQTCNIFSSVCPSNYPITPKHLITIENFVVF